MFYIHLNIFFGILFFLINKLFCQPRIYKFRLHEYSLPRSMFWIIGFVVYGC